jgi:hypothetical protein
VNSDTEKILEAVRQLFRADKLDYKSFKAILTLTYPNSAYAMMVACTDIIAWAESQDTKESKIVYQLAHESLAEIIKK